MENTELSYIGPERRTDRRVGADKGFEKLLKDFGLDRRSGVDRRKSASQTPSSLLIALPQRD